MTVTNPFRQQLCTIPESLLTPSEAGCLSHQLIQALLRFGSETEDNQKSTQSLEYGWVPDRDFGPQHICGFKLKGKPVLISDIISAVEGLEMPETIRNEFPHITVDEYEAAMRLVTLIVLAFEQSIPRGAVPM